MELAEKLVVLYSLFGVSMCSNSFSVTLPQSVEAVNGLCVLINCSFTIENKYDKDLQVNPKGIWLKDGTEEDKTVFDSKTPKNNKIKGRITGDLQKKDCTTIFNRTNKNDTGTYYFRLEAGPELKYTYKTPSVSINVRELKPTLSLYRDQTEVMDQRVLEGSSVSWLCFALSPCPTQPPTLTWSALPINISPQQIQNTSFISSQLNFIATHLHHGLRFNCTATYQLENKDSKTAQRSLVLRVLYPPKNTSVSVSLSGPVMLGGSVFLNCSSDGNPAVNYTWYRQNGEQIGTGASLTIRTDDTHSGLYCRAQNQHGAQTSSVQLDIQYAPRNTNVSVSPSGPVVLGSSVSLNCSSDGNPAVNYTWYRQNGEQIGTGPSLTIKTDGTHSGLYCRAQNQHGAQNSSVQLDIQYPPKNTSVSVSPSGPVLLGSSVSLNCSSDGNPAVNYTWYRQNGEQIGTGPSLTVNHTDNTYSGLYCRAQNQHGAKNLSVQLDIQYAPRNTNVSVSPSGPVVLGSSVSLNCSSEGNPAVNYTWYRQNGEQIGTGASLTIKTDGTHSGLYCRAQNQHGAQTSSVQLDIQYAPRNTSVSVSPSGPVMLGSSVSLNCSSDGNPAVSYTWYREHGEEIETGRSLTINNTENIHSSLYCRAQNQHGAQNSSAQLDIQYPPKNISVSMSPSGKVVLGSSVSLSCSSDGNPAVNYTWYTEDGEQIETGPSLTINQTNNTQSGLYYCKAQNQHGAQNTSAQLDIQYAPRNTSVSVSPSGPVMLGSSVSLSCSSDGNPAVNYTWYRENEHQIGTGRSLTINQTNKTHSGLYYCRAQNQHGAQNTSMHLDIQYAPQISSSSHCNSSSEGVLMCVCEVHGHPVPELEWRHFGQPGSPSLKPSIRNESVGSTGLKSFLSMHLSLTEMPSLQCVSSNQMGSTSQLFSVVPGHCSSTGHFQIFPMLVGALAGASAMMILCAIYLCRRRPRHKPVQEDTSGLLLNDRAVCQQQGDEEEEESLYANKSMLSPQQPLNGNNADLLHYSIIYFPNGKEGSGEIRGLSSLTADYATILYSSSKNPERETTEEDHAGTEEEIPQLTKEEATYGEYHLSQDLSVRI